MLREDFTYWIDDDYEYGDVEKMPYDDDYQADASHMGRVLIGFGGWETFWTGADLEVSIISIVTIIIILRVINYQMILSIPP